MLILLGRRHQQPAGRHIGSEIAANGLKVQRQTVQKRSGKRAKNVAANGWVGEVLSQSLRPSWDMHQAEGKKERKKESG